MLRDVRTKFVGSERALAFEVPHIMGENILNLGVNFLFGNNVKCRCVELENAEIGTDLHAGSGGV